MSMKYEEKLWKFEYVESMSLNMQSVGEIWNWIMRVFGEYVNMKFVSPSYKTCTLFIYLPRVE